MKPTIRDIADSLGISHATVSRVLNGKGEGFISAATRTRVLDTAREMGYRPNLAARALVTGRTRTVAVWMHTIATPFYATVLNTLEQQAATHGYALTLTRARQPYQSLAEMLESSAVDGVIAVDLMQNPNDHASYEVDRRRPLVFLGAHSPGVCDYVRVDLDIGASEAIRHLLAAGCRRIAYLAHEQMLYAGEERLAAYQRIMEEAGHPATIIGFPIDSRSSAKQAVVDYTQAHGHPDGLLCQNDDIAMGAFRALRDLGLRVPEDTRLVGCDGIEELEYFDPPLSSIVQPIDAMCALAWEYLERRISEPDAPPQQTTLPAHLVARASSR